MLRNLDALAASRDELPVDAVQEEVTLLFVDLKTRKAIGKLSVLADEPPGVIGDDDDAISTVRDEQIVAALTKLER